MLLLPFPLGHFVLGLLLLALGALARAGLGSWRGGKFPCPRPTPPPSPFSRAPCQLPACRAHRRSRCPRSKLWQASWSQAPFRVFVLTPICLSLSCSWRQDSRRLWQEDDSGVSPPRTNKCSHPCGPCGQSRPGQVSAPERPVCVPVHVPCLSVSASPSVCSWHPHTLPCPPSLCAGAHSLRREPPLNFTPERVWGLKRKACSPQKSVLRGGNPAPSQLLPENLQLFLSRHDWPVGHGGGVTHQT